jgi:hypothetical protein
MVSTKALEALDAAFILLTSVYLVYTLTVSPENFRWALIYIAMTTIYFIALIMSKLPAFNDYIGVVTYSAERKFFSIQNLIIISLVLFIGLILYTGQLGFGVVDAPVFSPIPGIGPEYQPLRSGIAALIEGRFFFCFILFTFMKITKKFFMPIVSQGASIIGTSAVFLAYHFFVYGSQSTIMTTVFGFGFISALLHSNLAFVMLIDALHVGNNIGVTWARISDVSIFIYLQTLLPWIVGGAILYLLWRRFK